VQRLTGWIGAALVLAVILINPSASRAAAFPQCPAVGLDAGCQFLISATNGGTTVASDPTQGSYDGGEDVLIAIANDSSAPISSLALSAESELFGFGGHGICEPGAAPVPAGCTEQPETAYHSKPSKPGAECGYEGEVKNGKKLGGPVAEACAFDRPAGEPAGLTLPDTVAIVGFAGNGDAVSGYEGPTSWFSGIGEAGASLDGSGVVNFSPALAPGQSAYFSLESPPAAGFGTATALTANLSATSVLQGTAVSDSASLTGAGVSLARGSVAYSVYSDASCTKLIAAAGSGALSNGVAAASTAVTLPPGSYYWLASYGGDVNNRAAASACGSEALTVLAATTTGTTQSAGGVSGPSLTMPVGIPVSDVAHISGALAKAGGTVKYSLYTGDKCMGAARYTSVAPVVNGVAGPSASVRPAVGRYYWQATYGGDGADAGSLSTCGGEVLVVALRADVGLPSARLCLSRGRFIAHPRAPRGVRLLSAEVFINGVLKRRVRLTAGPGRIDLTGPPRGSFHIAMVLESSTGKLYEDVRSFHACVAPRHRKSKQ
jgi:hypothetical protein